MIERGATLHGEETAGQGTGTGKPWPEGETMDAKSAAGQDLPAVIRPQPLLLEGFEALVQRNRPFARSLGRRPEQVEAIARVVFHHDGLARERFRDVAALTGHVWRLLGFAG